MQRLINDPTLRRTNHELFLPRFCEACVPSLWVLLLAGTTMLSACGGGTSGSASQIPATLSANWQFTVANPADGSFSGGLQGGFLVQKNGTVTGAVAYSVWLPTKPNPTVCNSGSATINGTISGQSVTLTANAGSQTFAFTGTLSLDGLSVAGTYTSTAGTAADGTTCGTAQTGLQWRAISVPPLTGGIQGSFHSTGGAAGLTNQDFPVSGSLTQGENVGASNATVTGILSFVNQATNLSDYPCFTVASVKGQVSGNTVLLLISGSDGSDLGQIGASVGSGLNTVTFDSTSNGYVLRSVVSPAYAVVTNACPGSGVLSSPGDSGSICLALGNTTACRQPIALSPAVLTFPAQTLGSTSAAQTITLTNTSSALLSGLTLTFTNNSGAANFTVTGDTCDIPGNPLGSAFALDLAQSCAITVTFAPQEASPLTATLTVTSPVSADNDTAFTVPITGTGVSAMSASTPKLDFGADGVSESSLRQLLSFTNHSGNPVRTKPGSSNRTFQDEENAEIE